MKRAIGVISLIIGVGFWASSQFDDGRRERDSRSLTPQERRLFEEFTTALDQPGADETARLRAVHGLIAFNSLRTQPYFVKALYDPSPQVAVAAIGGLRDLKYRIGRTGNIRLIALCSHPDARVRGAARRALPELADWRAAEFFIDEASRKDCHCRGLMLGTLEYVTGHSLAAAAPDGPRVTFADGVRKILDDTPAEFPEISEEESERLCALWREWFVKYRDRDPKAWLIDDLASGRGDKAVLIAALERLDARECAGPVRECLADEDPVVVVAAVRAARTFEDTEALPALLAAGEGAGLRVWEEISRSIAALCDRKDSGAIFEALQKADDEKFNFYDRALQQLTAASAGVERDEADFRERTTAFWREHLAAAAGLSDFEAWRARLYAESDRDRFQAAKNLRREGEAAVPLYIAALMDDSEAVRRVAERYLREITFYYFEYDPLWPREKRAEAVNLWRDWWESAGRRPTFERLLAVMQNRSETVRHRADAARGLRELSDWRAVPHLIAALGEGAEGLRHYAGTALVALVGVSFPKGEGWVENAEQSHEAWLRWWNTYHGKPKEYINRATITDITGETGDEYGNEDKMRDKLAIINRIASERDAGSIRHLVDLLDNRSFLLSVTAEEALERVTGRSFFYRRNVRISDRASVKEVWVEWYENR